MRRYLRWAGIGSGGVLLLAIVFAVYVYAASSRALDRTFSANAHPPIVPSDSLSIAEGARLARIRGCFGSCHGDAGGQVIDEPLLAVGAIPDLTRLVHTYDDAQLELVIRHGIKPNGRSVIEFMPSAMFSHLSDDDLGAIIAFLRSLPPANGPRSGIHFRPLAHAMIAVGRFGFAAQRLKEPVTHAAPNRADPVAFGRYLALSSCTECHGPELRGAKNGKPPDLRIAAGYSLEQFTQLMREGVPPDGRDLGLMKSAAVGRFANFTDEEIGALHAYLAERARSPATVTGVTGIDARDGRRSRLAMDRSPDWRGYCCARD